MENLLETKSFGAVNLRSDIERDMKHMAKLQCLLMESVLKIQDYRKGCKHNL